MRAMIIRQTDRCGSLRPKGRFFITAVLILVYLFPVLGAAQDGNEYEPARTGVSLNTGYTYDPSDDIGFFQISVFRLYDYDYIWPHSAPDNLRFKIEGAVGSAFLNDDARVIANAGVMALYYLETLETNRIRPYLEAGIGAVFTDYRVSGQDYRFNFNPQAGIGIEFKRENESNRFMALRAHHISNGGIGSSNRGLNSVVLMFGRFF